MEAGDVRSVRVRMWWTVCLAAMLSALFPPAGAQGTLCGATIVSDLVLDEDLTCVGTALVIGADGITLDLNGRTISGSGTGEGVLVSGRSGLTVKNGTRFGCPDGSLASCPSTSANSSRVRRFNFASS